MKLIRLALTAALSMALSPAIAQDAGMTEGQKLARLIFASIDEGDQGFIHMGNLEHYVENVFLGMDYNEDHKISFEEFSAWDPGYSQVAEIEGRPEAFSTATKILFSMWDVNGDGAISRSEMRRATNYDFQRADINNDAVLTIDEFYNFSVITVFRAAIRP